MRSSTPFATLLLAPSLFIAAPPVSGAEPYDQQSLDAVAALYESQHRYADAQHALERNRTILEQRCGAGDERVARVIHHLALLHQVQGHQEEAERLFKQALAMQQVELGPYHREVAASLIDLALLYERDGRVSDAELLLERVVAIWKMQQRSHPAEYAHALNAMAAHYYAQRRYAEALPLCEQALTLDERALGARASVVATDISNLADLYLQLDRPEDAEALYRKLMTAWRTSGGPLPPEVAATFGEYATFLRDHGKDLEAQLVEARAETMSLQ